MEDANRSFEVALPGDKIHTAANTKPPRFDTDGGNLKVSKLTGITTESKIGPGVILKVMAGDKFNAKTFAYNQPTGMHHTTDAILSALINTVKTRQ